MPRTWRLFDTDQLKSILLKEYELQGRELTLQEIRDCKSLPSPSTIFRYFNTTSVKDLWCHLLSEPEKSPQSRSEAIMAWLHLHPLIDTRALFELVGCTDLDVFNHDCGIPDLYIEAIEDVLKEYGYLAQRNMKDWTRKETQYLIDNYEKKSLLELSNYLGRGIGSVQRKLSRLRALKVICYKNKRLLQ